MMSTQSALDACRSNLTAGGRILKLFAFCFCFGIRWQALESSTFLSKGAQKQDSLREWFLGVGSSSTGTDEQRRAM